MVSAFDKAEAERNAQKSYRRKDLKIGPPKNSQWVWQTTELLESPAWQAMSLTARRVLDRIMVEHAGHACGENGKLIITHRQLQQFGINKNVIGGAIDELAYFGLIRVRKGRGGQGSRHCSIYRLTWFGDHEGGAATNDWKRITDADVQAWKEGGKAKAKKLRKRTAPRRLSGAVLKNKDLPSVRPIKRADTRPQDTASEIISPVPNLGSLSVPNPGSLNGLKNSSDPENPEQSDTSKTPTPWDHYIYFHGGGLSSGTDSTSGQSVGGLISDIGQTCSPASDGAGVLPDTNCHLDDLHVADCPKFNSR